MPRVESNLSAIEEKWGARWKESRLHEARRDPSRPKFFATYPYSYMNALPHVGHAYTMLRVDFLVRFERMRGKAVLFPFAFHVTGTPIVAAASRIREGEPTQRRILREMGVPEEEIPRFSDPWAWVFHFPREWRKDVDRLGLHLDWSREFITTERNPAYDSFIRWQYRLLRSAGWVAKGRHPVLWCPKDRAVVADHDRAEGEGEVPQEWTLYKMRVDPSHPLASRSPTFLLAATLRPDTVFGQTNVWIDPQHTYVAVPVGSEVWIVNEETVDLLPHQIEGVDPSRGTPLLGESLVGASVLAPGREVFVPVLPARFIRHDRGTGIVTSVPSDSPQDFLALEALKKGWVPLPSQLRGVVEGISPIPVIRTQRYGTESARKACEETGVTSDLDERISEATERAYQAGFYEGVLLENAGPFSGRPVAEGKKEIQEWLVREGKAVRFYFPSGKVVCRCLTPAVVRIVQDQWFLRYGDPEWKRKAREVLDRLIVLPPVARKSFENALEWLHDWACARESGLGTRLPWDEKWTIESLSDSTIYMAYYTIAPLIERGSVTGAFGERQGVDPADLSDSFFDYVFLGRGSPRLAARGTVTEEIVQKAREEFLYWYPLDFRNSGKDLLPNHLTFLLFHHAAVWEDSSFWPRAICVNGWVTVDGEKMSKSRGNFVLLREALDRYGASATRLALAYAGEGLDDANFDRSFAESAQRRLETLLEFFTRTIPTREERLPVDSYFLSVLHRRLQEATEAMEGTLFRTAVRILLFDLDREWSWYLRRSGGVPHEEVLREYRDILHRALAPFVPHIAEEAHLRMGLEGSVVDSPWPVADPGKIDPVAERSEEFLRSVVEDIREILKATRKVPRRILLYVAPEWKREVAERISKLKERGAVTLRGVMEEISHDPVFRSRAKEVARVVETLLREPSLRMLPQGVDEGAILAQSRRFLSEEFRSEVEIYPADRPGIPDPGRRSSNAYPGRPAIYIEGESA